MKRILPLLLVIGLLVCSTAFAMDKAGIESKIKIYQQQLQRDRNAIQQLANRVERYKGAIAALQDLLAEEEAEEEAGEKTEAEQN